MALQWPHHFKLELTTTLHQKLQNHMRIQTMMPLLLMVIFPSWFGEMTDSFQVFSFGVLVHELLTGEIPARSLGQIVKGVIPPLPEKSQREYPTLFKLFREATVINPKKRPTSIK